MKLHLAAIVFFGLGIVSIGMSQDSFRDIPDSHWVIEDMHRFKQDGLIAPYIEGLICRAPLLTRTVIAGRVHQCYKSLRILADNYEKTARKLSIAISGPDADKARTELSAEAERLKEGVTRWEPMLKNLVHEFNPELHKLEPDPNSVIRTCERISRCQVPAIGSSLVQFRDVPENHWAAKQVLELRRLGFIDGYPSGGSASKNFIQLALFPLTRSNF